MAPSLHDVFNENEILHHFINYMHSQNSIAILQLYLSLSKCLVVIRNSLQPNSCCDCLCGLLKKTCLVTRGKLLAIDASQNRLWNHSMNWKFGAIHLRISSYSNRLCTKTTKASTIQSTGFIAITSLSKNTVKQRSYWTSKKFIRNGQSLLLATNVPNPVSCVSLFQICQYIGICPRPCQRRLLRGIYQKRIRMFIYSYSKSIEFLA